MRHEPPIDRALIIETVRTRYGLDVETITFVPVGFATACYQASTVDGRRYFLKLWPDPRFRDGERQAIVLRLLRAFHERGLEPRVPYPIPTQDGALSAEVAGIPLALFPFLPGEPLPAELPPDLADEFGRTIAAIHLATTALADVLPPRETFAFPWEADLRRALAATATTGSGARPGLRGLRGRVLARQDEILAQLARLHDLRRAVRRLPDAFVLCHTDMGGDNALIDDDGQLFVLDWDVATVAPPEHDLWHVSGPVLASYLDAGGSRSLHRDRFTFYVLRRGFEDMTARLVRMLDADTSPQEDAELLEGIDSWGFARWAALDARLADLEGVLERYAV
jgi:Ser/Thr protein kinase RdoA (MazF antagonist)